MSTKNQEYRIHYSHTNSQEWKKFITTILVSKTKVKSYFGIYKNGPRKATPKEIQEIIMQGDKFRDNLSTTLKNHTYLYKGNG
jgi:hypothetical protein